MKTKLAIFRLFALIAIAVCAAMLMDYLLPNPAFCGFTASCEEVTRSVYGRPLGVPLPLWGLAAFGAFYGLTLIPAGRLGRLIGPAAILAGVGGLSFILLQLLVIRRVCPLCMVIDACGLFLAATELIAAPKTAAMALPARRKAAWVVAAVVAMSAAPVWAVVKPARPVPEMVQSFWTEGKITVVEVIDFDCPYCRMTHAALDELLASRKEAVQRIRFVLPLRAHKNARPAARAYLAACQQSKGEEMAAALLAAQERSPATCEKLAAKIDLNMDSYKTYVADPAVDQEIDRRIEWLDEKTYPGLPVIWIENQELLGAQTHAALHAAWQRAEIHLLSSGL